MRADIGVGSETLTHLPSGRLSFPMYACPSFDISIMPLILQADARLHCSAVVASTGAAGAVAHDPVKRQIPSAKIERRRILVRNLRGAAELKLGAVVDMVAGLTAGWVNGSVQSYLDILPPDYRTRLKTLPTHGNLRIAVCS